MIVAGVDFSEGSAVAVRWAQELSIERRESLRLIHVASGPLDPDSLDPSSRAWLSGLMIPAAEVGIRHGTPWVELVRAAEQLRAALLVAGTHGRSGYQCLRLGSTAAQVALRSRTPVVLISPERVAERRSSMSWRGFNEERR